MFCQLAGKEGCFFILFYRVYQRKSAMPCGSFLPMAQASSEPFGGLSVKCVDTL